MLPATRTLATGKSQRGFNSADTVRRRLYSAEVRVRQPWVLLILSQRYRLQWVTQAVAITTMAWCHLFY